MAQNANFSDLSMKFVGLIKKASVSCWDVDHTLFRAWSRHFVLAVLYNIPKKINYTIQIEKHQRCYIYITRNIHHRFDAILQFNYSPYNFCNHILAGSRRPTHLRCGNVSVYYYNNNYYLFLLKCTSSSWPLSGHCFPLRGTSVKCSHERTI